MLKRKIEMIICVSMVCSMTFTAVDSLNLNRVYAETSNTDTSVAGETQRFTTDNSQGSIVINNVKLKSKLAQAAGKGSDYTGDLTSADLASIKGSIDLSNLDIKDSDMDVMKYLTGVSSINLSNNTAITYNGFNKKYFDWTTPKNLNFSGCTGIKLFTMASYGMFAFSDCKNLTSIDLPERIQAIPIGCFTGCTGLTSVKIPASVLSIRKTAFQNCTSLKCVKVQGSTNTLEDDCFSGCTGLSILDMTGTKLISKDTTSIGCPSTTVLLYGQDGKLSPGEVSIGVGETKAVTSEIPSDKTITWGSSDTSVVTVSDKGEVTGVKPGTAYVYAKASDDTYGGLCSVTVTDNGKDKDKSMQITTDLAKGTTFKLGNDAKISINVKNNSTETQEASLILSLFNKDNNKFISSVSAHKNIAAGDSADLTGSMKLPTQGNYEIRAFVWNNLDDMRPISDVITIPINDTGK
ncbi:leucine-rich repeat protein [Clostridium sp. AWRP]|uniref:leucine-rich repeat protein n=1 Tax=Clostridium sp. AWRP TaxID=2212991 RepID=UPI000FD8823F|nr:leucine-rich repeat protein [Clostridium sp. AWRP]AZV57192.1 hypothetical protein DMR38_11585 [Clostridium sp. AWRP]